MNSEPGRARPAPGYTKPLYLLAFDHRGSFQKNLFGAGGTPSPAVAARVTDTKTLIYEAFEESITRGAPVEGAGILVDEQFGADVARRATAGGFVLAMPVETEIRPGLVVQTLAELQAAGVEPDVWKIEGLAAREDCERVAEQARSGGREEVACIVLGRGADHEGVAAWLRAGAGVPGYVGFAVGRTLWWDELKGYIAGSLAATRPSSGSPITTSG